MVILLGILAGGGWWGWKSLMSSSAEPTCTEQKLTNNRLLPKQVVLNVYNGGARAGSAGRVADVLKKRGFNIDKVANEPKGDKTDVVALRGASTTAPEMLLVAGQLNQRAQLIADGRTDHTVDLVIGAGFGSVRLKGIPSVAVPAGTTVCLPIVGTPQPIPSGQNPN
ncbi:MAG TPA: LytR C-terminal domain-containing protein [Kribbella sp.]|nr:LytR C-terminal domain-containing protein [Kribbella sp.]